VGSPFTVTVLDRLTTRGATHGATVKDELAETKPWVSLRSAHATS